MLVKLVVEEEPPDKKQKQQVEVEKTDRFRAVKGEYVCGTRRIKRFVFRVKTST